jgi:hypothetical protein
MTTEAIPAVIGDKIRCDACPVMCYIKPGAAGACDRYANHDGVLVRVDPHIVLERTVEHGGRLVPFRPAATGTARSSSAGHLRHRDQRQHHLYDYKPALSSCRRRSTASTWSPS